MAIPAKNTLGNPNVTEGNFQVAIEQLRESVIGSGKAYDSANTYMQYDTCVYNGITYYSKINSNTGNTPSIGAIWGDIADLISAVVHKTGDETIAGVKTFNDNAVFNGNVGIGATPSAWNVGYTRAIEIGSYLDNGIIWSSLNSQHSHIGIGANFYVDNSMTTRYKDSYPASQYQQEVGRHLWFIAPSGTAGNTITWKNAMTLDASGSLNVVGNTVSGYVAGNYAAPGTVYNGVFATDSSSYTVMYGRTASDYSAIFNGVVGGIGKAVILANGNFQSATNSYGSTSDIKLKENIVDTSPKLEKLMHVKVRNFNYIGDEQKQIGVVAQEIEQIFPSIVYETKDTKQVEVKKVRQVIDKEAVLSEDGVVLEEATYKDEEYTELETVETGETTKNVKYSVIYMMMLKAMQEQQETINDLKARVEVLEAR